MVAIMLNREEREILIQLSEDLLGTCKMVFNKLPDISSFKQFTEEQWEDHTLDIGIELKRLIQDLKDNNRPGYTIFLTSEYSLIIKKIVDYTTPKLLEYFKGTQKCGILKRFNKSIAKSKLNNLRYKLGMDPVK